MEKERKSFRFRDNYYDGYSRKIVIGSGNKAHIEYVYEGIYHIPQCTEGVWIKRKIIYFLLSLLTVLSHILEMCIETQLNSIKVLTALESLLLLILIALISSSLSRLTLGRRMTRWEYRMGVLTLKESSFLVFLLESVILLISVVLLFKGRIHSDGVIFSFFLFSAVSAVLAFILFFSVRNEKYGEEISSDTTHGEDITNDYGESRI